MEGSHILIELSFSKHPGRGLPWLYARLEDLQKCSRIPLLCIHTVSAHFIQLLRSFRCSADVARQHGAHHAVGHLQPAESFVVAFDQAERRGRMIDIIMRAATKMTRDSNCRHA